MYRCRGAFNATFNVEVHEGQSAPTVGEENEKQLLCKDIIHVIDEFKLVFSVYLFLSFLSTSSIFNVLHEACVAITKKVRKRIKELILIRLLVNPSSFDL